MGTVLQSRIEVIIGFKYLRWQYEWVKRLRRKVIEEILAAGLSKLTYHLVYMKTPGILGAQLINRKDIEMPVRKLCNGGNHSNFIWVTFQETL